MSLYSDLPPAASGPSPDLQHAVVVEPSAPPSSSAPQQQRQQEQQPEARQPVQPVLLIPQRNIVRQNATPSVRKKPMLMKPVKAAAPIVNLKAPVPPVEAPRHHAEADHEQARAEDEERPFVEYDPSVPNEYLQICRERRAERERQQQEREFKERQRAAALQPPEPPAITEADLKISGEDAYVRRMRMSGMAAAPPRPERSPSPSPPPQPSSQPIAKQSVAERLMAKMGWSAGQGLGAQNQGIPQALMATKCVNGHVVVVEPKKKRHKPVPSVVVLDNMVGVGDVDSELERETADECTKFGDVRRCVVHQARDRVRIFVQFNGADAAGKAVEGLHGRVFAGRAVRASVYDADAFAQGNYEI
ncbi:hypothetical protein PBRA_004321 [Plasmodiophora brassicae]|uniref:G-patch domain-containing protein n=1 Tax=Plasmodiophora brassicae TaxID=37360 RepID=A0A0G4IKB4_PLABS|nr:hypothetical protein PBRA_004321 [Plasmodiophora brassicae]